MAETSYYYISPVGTLSRMSDLSSAVAAATVEGFIWIDYRKPDKDAMSEAALQFKLHPLSIEDCIDTNQVPKIEDFPGNTFLIFNSFGYEEGQLTVDEIDIFIGDKFLITVSEYDSKERHPLNDMMSIVESNITKASQGPAFLMHVVLDYIVDHKFIAVEALEDELELAEERMLARPADFNVSDMLTLRRELLLVRKSLFNEREILVKICRKDCSYISDEAIFHYRDIYDHLSKFFELIEAYRDIVTSLMELHTSMLSNVMAKASNDTNATMKRLTMITTIFMPLTLLSGIGGMSEYSMMTGTDNWRISYPLMIVGMIIISIISYYLLRRVNNNTTVYPRVPKLGHRSNHRRNQ